MEYDIDYSKRCGTYFEWCGGKQYASVYNVCNYMQLTASSSTEQGTHINVIIICTLYELIVRY